MGELTLIRRSAGDEVRLYDHAGTLVGVIAAPIAAEPLGAGRETVYLSRGVDRRERDAVAA